jgi:hypothetical protein
MKMTPQWRIQAEWHEMRDTVEVALACDDLDPLVTGTVREDEGESLYAVLGNRPPTISDDQAVRLIVTVYLYLALNTEPCANIAIKTIDLLPWLRDEVGTRHAAVLWPALTSRLDGGSGSLPASPPVEESPRVWRFAAKWLDESAAEWRLAHLELTWRRDGEVGNLATVAKVNRAGLLAVKEVINDDLLLPAGELEWLLRELMKDYWLNLQSYGFVDIDTGNLLGWLGATRGRTGRSVVELIELALRTFGAGRTQQE